MRTTQNDTLKFILSVPVSNHVSVTKSAVRRRDWYGNGQLGGQLVNSALSCSWRRADNEMQIFTVCAVITESYSAMWSPSSSNSRYNPWRRYTQNHTVTWLWPVAFLVTPRCCRLLFDVFFHSLGRGKMQYQGLDSADM